MGFRVIRQQDQETRRRPGSVRPVSVSLIGPSPSPLEFSRFLLSSAGLHLLLVWAVMTVGLHSPPLRERPLVVRLIESPQPSPTPAQPARARARQQATPGQVAQPVGPKEIVQPTLPLPSIGRQESGPSRAVEMIDHTVLDDRRGIAPQRATQELVKGLGIPPRILSSGGAQVAGGGISGPKSVGAPGKVAMVPGALAGKGLDSGPALIGSEGGETGPGQAERGGSRRLGAVLAVPLIPTVTIGARQGAGGRAVDGAGNGATAGKFAAPNYGTNPLPKYPPLAREKGYEGTVYLRVLVQADGRVGRLAIDRSSGHEILDRAAVDSVKEWTFLPAHKGGKSVQSWVLLPVKFMLD